MKRLILSVIAAGLMFTAQAQVPGMISYQGILVNSSGDPVTDGTHYVKFNFYDAASGGTLKYSSLGTSSGNTVTTYKGMFTFIIGSGSIGNDPIPTNIWDTDTYVEVTADGAVLSPRVQITSTGYSFKAETANAMDAAGLTGTANLPNTVLDTDLQDLADGSLSGSLVGTGISATNVTTGTLPNTVLDADLQNLADGSLSGSLVGTGISATNVTTGTLPNTVLDADLQDLADGSLSGSLVGTGISATNITAGTLPDARLEATVDITTGLNVGSSKFAVDANGNITKINNITTSFPGSQGAANSFLTNNGSGTLSWATTLGGSQVGTGISATNVTTGTLPLGVLPASVITGGGTAGQLAIWSGTTGLSADANLAWDNTNKRLGIGTSTPVNKLDVEGGVAIGATYSGTSAAPANGLLVEGNVGIGTSTAAATLDVKNSSSSTKALNVYQDYSGASPRYGIYNTTTGSGTSSGIGIYNNTSGGVSGSATGFQSLVSGNASSAGIVYGFDNSVSPYGTGAGYGIYNTLQNYGTGFRYGIYNSANATATNTSPLYGAYNYVNHSGSGNTFGLYSDVNKAASQAGTLYGLYIISDNDGTGNSYLMYASSIGSTTGTEYGLYVTGEDVNYFNGKVGIGTNTPDSYGSGTNKVVIIGTGYISGGAWFTSDIRYKKDFSRLTGTLSKIRQLDGVSFSWKRDENPDMNFPEGRHYGFKAQEVEKVFPELVSTGKDGYKSMNYDGMAPVLLEAIKEQQNQIEDLKSTIDVLQAKLGQYQNLSAQVEELKKLITTRVAPASPVEVKSTVSGNKE